MNDNEELSHIGDIDAKSHVLMSDIKEDIRLIKALKAEERVDESDNLPLSENKYFDAKTVASAVTQDNSFVVESLETIDLTDKNEKLSSVEDEDSSPAKATIRELKRNDIKY